MQEYLEAQTEEFDELLSSKESKDIHAKYISKVEELYEDALRRHVKLYFLLLHKK